MDYGRNKKIHGFSKKSHNCNPCAQHSNTYQRGLKLKHERGNPSKPPSCPPSLRWAGVQTTKSGSNYKNTTQKAKRIRDNSKTIIHTSSSGKKGITVTLGKSPVWPFFCFCIKQGRTGGVTHRYGPFFISGNRAYLSVARNSDTSAVVMSKYITRFSASNSPVTLYRFFGS